MQDLDTKWGVIVSSHIVDRQDLDTKWGVIVSSHIVGRQDLDTKWGVIVSSHIVDDTKWGVCQCQATILYIQLQCCHTIEKKMNQPIHDARCQQNVNKTSFMISGKKIPGISLAIHHENIRVHQTRFQGGSINAKLS